MNKTIPAAQRPGPRRHRFFRSVSALILREMTTTYGRSPGGYLWAIIEPLAGMILLSVLFSAISRQPPLGNNFMYFFAAGLLPFTLYTTLSTTIASSVRFSRALLEYPAVSYIDALTARILLNGMTQLLVMFLLFSGVIWFYDLSVILNWGGIFNALSMVLCFSFGVGVMNCYLITAYPLWERIWAILNRPMFFVSGILFTPESLPWQFREYLMWNPLMHITSEMRHGMFITYEAVYVNALYVYMVSLGLSVLGLVFLRRYHKDILLK